MTPELLHDRRARLRCQLRRQGLAALLVSHAANRYYLSGFELHNPQDNESSGMLLVCADSEPEKDILYTDPRFTDAAQRVWPKERLHIYHGDAAEVINASIAATVSGPVGIEARSLSLDTYERLAPGLELCRTQGLVEGLRMIKSPQELARMEAACHLNHRLMAWLPSTLRPGRSEAEVAWDVEKFFREHGASELAFPTIVGRGTNAALPHCVPGTSLIAADEEAADALVLVDAGCRVQDYCSDQTRTYWVGGTPAPRFVEMLQTVREAQRRALALIRPGVACCEVFQAAWEHFVELGVESGFTHGLGHGVGLETHEAPSFNRINTTVLEPGMIMTVEPGLYDITWGGVRWEHMVAVTKDGHQVL